MTADRWFGLITGFRACQIVWWVVDRHRRR